MPDARPSRAAVQVAVSKARHFKTVTKDFEALDTISAYNTAQRWAYQSARVAYEQGWKDAKSDG